MTARYFGGPKDGQWQDLAPDASRMIWVPAVAANGDLQCHRYWRYGTRLVHAGHDVLTNIHEYTQLQAP